MEGKQIKQKFKIKGMHCASCELTIEDKLSSVESLKKVNADRNKNNLTFESEKIFSEKEVDDLINDLGYNVVFSDQEVIKPRKINYTEMIKAFAIASIVMGLFLLLQKLIYLICLAKPN